MELDPQWYVVDVLFAEHPNQGADTVLCESCTVLFHADSAEAAYDRALGWADAHVSESRLRLVGIVHMHSLIEAPGDGVEIAGSFTEQPNPWDRLDELVPPREQIPVVVLERNLDTPVGELLDEDTLARLRRVASLRTVREEPPN